MGKSTTVGRFPARKRFNVCGNEKHNPQTIGIIITVLGSFSFLTFWCSSFLYSQKRIIPVSTAAVKKQVKRSAGISPLCSWEDWCSFCTTPIPPVHINAVAQKKSHFPLSFFSPDCTFSGERIMHTTIREIPMYCTGEMVSEKKSPLNVGIMADSETITAVYEKEPRENALRFEKRLKTQRNARITPSITENELKTKMVSEIIKITKIPIKQAMF